MADTGIALITLGSAALGGVVGYFIRQLQEGPGAEAKSALTKIEANILRMAALLIEEWNAHRKKRSGVVDGPDDLEFVLTIRPHSVVPVQGGVQALPEERPEPLP